MNCTAASPDCQQLTVRRHFESLTVGRTAAHRRCRNTAIPADLGDLARHHVVDKEVGMMLRAHQEFAPVGGKTRALNGKVLKVDRLDFGVGLPIHLEGDRRCGSKSLFFIRIRKQVPVGTYLRIWLEEQDLSQLCCKLPLQPNSDC